MVVLIAMLLLAMGLTASPVLAGAADQLIEDASDGVVDGDYSVATVRAALAIVRADPSYSMYSDVEWVLEDYLKSITKSSPTPTPKPTREPTATPTPTPTGTPTPVATHTATPTPKPTRSPRASHTPTPVASSASAAPLPLPTTSSWDRAKTRLGAVPWFFAGAAIALVAGIVVQRRRRAN
jgi:hypothetical protein